MGSGRLEGGGLGEAAATNSNVFPNLEIPLRTLVAWAVSTPVGSGRAFAWFQAPHLLSGSVLPHFPFTPSRSVLAPLHSR